MLVAEKLLLLLTVDDTGRVRGQFADYGLAGAVLMDLSFRGRIRVTEKGERTHHRNRVVVVDDAPTDDAVLDDVLARLAGADRFMSSSIARIQRHLRKPLQERLARAGVLREEQVKLAGLVTMTRYPIADPGPKDELQATLYAVLLADQAPDADTAALIGVLSAVEATHTVLGIEPTREQKRAVKARAKQLRKENWAAEVAYRAIQSTRAAASGGGA